MVGFQLKSEIKLSAGLLTGKLMMREIHAQRHHVRFEVISGHLQCNSPCPLYSRKRTFTGTLEMSAKGQRRTLMGFAVR